MFVVSIIIFDCRLPGVEKMTVVMKGWKSVKMSDLVNSVYLPQQNTGYYHCS